MPPASRRAEPRGRAPPVPPGANRRSQHHPGARAGERALMRSSRPHPRPRLESSGFTLIEVMLALAILAFVTTIMWGSFNQTITNKRAIETAQERTHTVRVALMRMAREIEMGYLSASENTALADRRTFLVGSSHGDVDELSFSSFAHQRLRAGLAEGDTSIISYFGERDPDNRRVLNLMRRETRRLQAENPSNITGEAYVLCPDVRRLKFSYYDYKLKEWVN